MVSFSPKGANNMALTQVQGQMIAPSTTLTTPIVATTMGVGGATPSGSGSGITFPATQSASSDANTLDDYEEGTWTPILAFSGGSTGITYASRSATYTKIGRYVYVACIVELTNKGSSTGNAEITNLPFTVASGYGRAGSLASYEAITFTGTLSVLAGGNTTALTIYNTTIAGVRSNITNTSFANTSLVYASLSYEI
jgi:hypothetical protein